MKNEKLILNRSAKILRQKALPVPFKDIGTKKLGDTIARMKKAVRTEEDGVAIAAPQVGVGLRIFVVKGGVLPRFEKDSVFINPEIVKISKKKRKAEEGCLSIRWLYGAVERNEKITISAWDEKGVKRTFGATGLLAQIFQHELDHLEGILFIDKAENVRNLPPPSKENGEN